MVGKGIKKKLIKVNNKYYVNIDITKEEWIEMLLDNNIFYNEAKEMILAWYYEDYHLASSKSIMNQYKPNIKGTSYNGIVIALGKRILEYLNNRFWIEQESCNNKECFWAIPFEGWYEGKYFIWKLRDELVEAIEIAINKYNYNEEFTPIRINQYESVVYNKDGKVIKRYVTTYERKASIRNEFIKYYKKTHNNLSCEACGFDFQKYYGSIGKDFIEVHHNKPLSSTKKETPINIKTDLNCLCSNCHKMIHRQKNSILTVKQLKMQIERNINENSKLELPGKI